MDKEIQSFLTYDFEIETEILVHIVTKYLQWNDGYEELDYLKKLGGYEYIKTGLETDLSNGISSSSIQKRIN